MKRGLFWVLLPGAVLACLLLLAIFFTVLAFMPPVISVVSLAVMAVIALWFFVGRRSTNRPASEGSLLGRQKSVEGLM